LLCCCWSRALRNRGSDQTCQAEQGLTFKHWLTSDFLGTYTFTTPDQLAEDFIEAIERYRRSK
jgi:hypothetical protein